MAHRSLILGLATLGLATGSTGCGTSPAPMTNVTDAAVDRAPPPPPPPPPPPVPFVLHPTNVDVSVTERAPAVLRALALPSNAEPAVGWVGPEGNGLVVARDGRFLSVDPYGAVAEIERLPGDPRLMTETPAVAIVERYAGQPLALVPSGGLTVLDGWVRNAPLPMLLQNARTTIEWGNEALWATADGLYTTQGTSWFRLDRAMAAVTNAAALVAGPASEASREAYVLRADGELGRLVVEPAGTGLRVTWSDPIAGLTLGPVRAITRFRDARYISRAQDLLRVGSDGAVTRLRFPMQMNGPVALAPSPDWLWLAWQSADRGVEIARLGANGQAEFIARAVSPAGQTVSRVQLAVDSSRGDVGLVLVTSPMMGMTPARTVATRVVVEPPVSLVGFAEGAVVTSPSLALRVFPPQPEGVQSVDFLIDENREVSVMAPPFGWGNSGALVRDMPMLEFGSHEVEVVVHYQGAADLRRSRTFQYVSPLGRVPTFDADIAPVYAARCARCHSTSIARDLRGFDRMVTQGPLVAQAVQSRRMPPDLSIDVQTIRLFTAWVAGGMPR